MSEPAEAYYTEERWGNWLGRLQDEDIDLEDEDSARLLWNMQDDAAIAVAKILADYEDDVLDEEEAMERLERVQSIVLSEPEVSDEDALALVDGVQTSLVTVFYAAQEFVVAGPVEEGAVEDYVAAAADAAAEDDVDAALGYFVQAGTLIIDGAELDVELAEGLEYPLSEWFNGLDSLESALAEPEVVEEEEES
jgi:hypothetical protein